MATVELREYAGTATQRQQIQVNENSYVEVSQFRGYKNHAPPPESKRAWELFCDRAKGGRVEFLQARGIVDDRMDKPYQHFHNFETDAGMPLAQMPELVAKVGQHYERVLTIRKKDGTQTPLIASSTINPYDDVMNYLKANGKSAYEKSVRGGAA